DGIAPAPRGVPQIEVTFDIDANGILNVSAVDKATGKEQHIRIEASSGLSDAEIQRMRDEAKANEAADKAEKERIDKINTADALTFQAEKFLKENGDKVPADVKSEVETNCNALKEAVKAQNIADIDKYSEALNKAFEKMYQAGQQAGGPQGGPQGPFQGGPQPNGPQPEGPDEQ
ncbi:MAG: Hsp70 family protein, partial [Candidatus Cryptobacteroides sp.]|nr:Hsp70 family protein [Candidatus Cryptobacteroides sp.]